MNYYPSRQNPTIAHAYQCEHWGSIVDWTVLTPMVRINDKDFYTGEILMDIFGRLIIPIRWYKKSDELFADALLVNSNSFATSILQEEYKAAYSKIPWPKLCMTLNLTLDYEIDVFLSGEKVTLIMPNNNRIIAKGKRVFSVPITLFADDTSGNQSKKYNKHEAIYFTLSGLPTSIMQKEYNIHFVSASNVCSSLHMLDGIVDDINNSIKNGIISFNATLKEEVIIKPFILAVVADNPMASLLSNHTAGSAVCRNCTLYHVPSKQVSSGYASKMIKPHPQRIWSETLLEAKKVFRSFGENTAKETNHLRRKGIKDYLSEKYKDSIDLRATAENKRDTICQLIKKHENKLFNPLFRVKGI